MIGARASKGERPIDITCCYEEIPLPSVSVVSLFFLLFSSLLFSSFFDLTERSGNSLYSPTSLHRLFLL